jgi:hypothetical protein
MATRQSAREALAALFVANGSFTTVNDFAPIDLKGTTKVLNIYARASRMDRMSRDVRNNFHVFNLDVFVKRTGTGADEDDLDTLHEAIVTVCVANPTNANWNHLELSEPSEPLFAEVAGIPYRLERHRVTIKITS